MPNCDWELPTGDDSVRCAHQKGHTGRHSFEPVVIATNVGLTHYVGDDCPGGHEDVMAGRTLSNLAPRWLREHDREIRIAALIEAARLMCAGCRLGDEIDVLQEGTFEGSPYHANEGLCAARSIIFEIVENAA